MSALSDLDGKVVLVTGAARGTGAAIAKRFVEHGAHVWLGDVAEEAGRATAASLGERAHFAPHDVTDAAAWGRVVAAALAAHGRLDVLVNNAGVLHIGTVERTEADVFRRVFEVNTVGPYLGIRAVLAPMRAQGAGAIVNVSSIDALLGMNGVSAYCASKWGLRGLTKSAATELGRDGIRVNSVCPAGGNPAMYGPWMEKLVGFLDQTRAYSNNRGLPGEASLEAIADAVLFLASDASRHCTGIDLPVDGGAHAGRFIPGFNTV
ncbi:MAG: SDR family oxidoreductase [Myxococcota bacterium]